ncbi:MAG: hypothetical protein WAN99_04450, partial [Methanoculleus sp.]
TEIARTGAGKACADHRRRTEQGTRLLTCLKEGPLGARDVMQCLGISHRPTFLYDYRLFVRCTVTTTSAA